MLPQISLINTADQDVHALIQKIEPYFACQLLLLVLG